MMLSPVSKALTLAEMSSDPSFTSVAGELIEYSNEVIYTTFANAPLPADYKGLLYITDIGGGSWWVSNGITLSPKSGTITLYDLDTPSAQTLGTAKVMAQNLIPAGLITNRSRLRITYTFSKSASAETCAHNFRLGLTGTTSDTSIGNTGAPGGTNVAVGNILEFQRLSATSLLRLGMAITGGYNGPSTTAIPAAVTVPDMDINPLFLSLTSLSSANVEVYTLHDYRVELITKVA